jgi:hypothetical protein
VLGNPVEIVAAARATVTAQNGMRSPLTPVWTATVRCCVQAAEAAGLVGGAGSQTVTDELIGQVVGGPPFPPGRARAVVGIARSSPRTDHDVGFWW